MNAVNSRWAYGSQSNQNLLEVYIGTHADKYLLAQARLSDPPRKICWNWAAALGGPVWLFYRKMYKWLFIWLLIGVPVDFVYFAAPALDSLAGNPAMNVLQDNYLTLSVLYVLITAIVLGCWGTYLYLQQSEKIVKMVKARTPASIAAAILDEKGAPSPWRVLAGLILIGGIYLATYLLAFMFQKQGFLV